MWSSQHLSEGVLYGSRGTKQTGLLPEIAQLAIFYPTWKGVKKPPLSTTTGRPSL
ncbi:hypothetical protein Cadr_000027239 [Camelus dromedarius]|uniref:Uncharacterized protein n=1 Tax=Camelus dromedarius TaxID=9838 RepID=A0A5N4CE12_CAMDR|nr:hypothetical protein Cadr_000027239 [Camelus dromedarius]